MKIKEINQEIKRIAKGAGFAINKEIYRGTYYSKDNLRNIIYSGIYQNKIAILKYYDDPRITYEPISLDSFLKNNKSKIITAPKIYKKQILSASKGWFIAERIPDDFSNYNTPLNNKERKEFLDVYLEYRKNFPRKHTRKLLLIEKLSPDNFHIFRINRWFELAQKAEAERMIQNKKLFLNDSFIILYEKAIKAIRNEFKNRKMIWCHGHFKPHEIFTDKKGSKYYLIDFAHTAMFPEGYELAFMIWSDYLMADKKWNLSYSEWREGIDRWLVDLEKIAKILAIKNYKRLLRISLAERVLGTIFADILASDRPDVKKKSGIKLMERLIKDIL